MTTKQDLINQQKELQKEVDKLAEKISQMPDEDILMVPDNIHLNNGGCILFNDDHQMIFIAETGYYSVVTQRSKEFFHQPHKLIPCDKDNLEAAKVYYHSYYNKKNLENKGNYGVYDGSNLWWVSDDNEIQRANPENYTTILQAVPVEG